MTSLAHFGISHLSPSSLDLWRNAPGLWAARYLCGIRDEGEAPAWRGKAVEDGMNAILRGLDGKDAATNTFNMNSVGETSDEIEAERKLILPMLEQVKKWKAPSPVIATQLKVEHWLDDVPVPLLGYLDFVFEDGLILDLKTTKACPSSPRPSHVRQVALYRAARNNAKGALLYVTHAKHAYYEIEDDAARDAISELRRDALTLIAFLSKIDNPLDALHCLPINKDDFRYSPKIKVEIESMMAS